MTLKDTIPMMESSDYKERLAAECAQLLIRVNALMAVLADSDAGTLTLISIGGMLCALYDLWNNGK